MRETPRRAGKVVRPDSAMPAAILSGSVLSCHPRSCPPPRSGDVSSPCSPLAAQNSLGRDVPAPTRTINYFGVGDGPFPHLPRPRNQHPLGRDVPAPTRSINYFGVGDVSSPHLPRARNARHQFGTSPALPQPGFKTLKGFQTVAGVKAARPPPPVPCPQNIQPPPHAEGVGGGGTPEFPQAVSPNPSRCSAIPRRRKKAHRGSLAGGEPSLAVSRGVALSRGSPCPPASASFCVLCGPALPAAKPER